MKKTLIRLSSIFLLVLTAFTGGDEKLTLKEKIEQSKEVKVFYCLREIIDEFDEILLKGENIQAKTPIRSNMPVEFGSKDIRDSILNILNKGLEVGNAFVEGDITSLPESKNKKTQFRDFSNLPNGFYVLINVEGEYKRAVQKKIVDGVTILDASNSMEINAHMSFYEVTNGEVEKYGDMFTKSILLGNAKTPTTKSDRYESLEYMEKNFPALPLLDEYKTTTYRFARSFAENQLKKHNKTVSKRK